MRLDEPCFVHEHMVSIPANGSSGRQVGRTSWGEWLAVGDHSEQQSQDPVLLSYFRSTPTFTPQSRAGLGIVVAFPRVGTAPPRAVRLHENDSPEVSLAVQWLRLCTSTAGAIGSIPGQGTKIPHAVQRRPKKKKRDSRPSWESGTPSECP